MALAKGMQVEPLIKTTIFDTEDKETWKAITNLNEIDGYGFYYLANDIEVNSSVEISEIVCNIEKYMLK